MKIGKLWGAFLHTVGGLTSKNLQLHWLIVKTTYLLHSLYNPHLLITITTLTKNALQSHQYVHYDH